MYHGNNAYQLNTPAPAIQRVAKGKPAAVSKPKVGVKIWQILLVFAMLFGLIWRYVVIYDQGSEIAKQRAILAEINAENTRIQMEIDRITEKTKLEEYAINVLGMRKPDKSQFVYITLRQGDTMDSLANNRLNDGSGWGGLIGLVEYIR